MTDRDLIRRAEELGVLTSYLDWRNQRVRVPAETLRAIVAAITLGAEDRGTAGQRPGSGTVPEAPAAGRPADSSLAGGAAVRGVVGAAVRAAGSTVSSGLPGGSTVPGLPDIPSVRSWGFAVQLYSVRSRHSWGHGDFRDLADLATWSARELGANFIVVNPLHAPEPAAPLSDSPYLPMTRRYLSPLYLRVEDVEEFERLPALHRQHIARLAEPLIAANGTPDLIDRNRVWAAKREALMLVHRVPRTSRREAGYRRFADGEGTELAAWATWCALAESHGPDWRRWPPDLADPRHAARLTAPGGPLAERAEFYAWLQWLAHGQLEQAQRAATAAGMSIGVIGDLAVGAHPGGADAWSHQDLLVRGMSVGAPPDAFNQRGQDWTQPPWHPLRLAADSGRPLADLLRSTLRSVGGLRVDHVMGLARLWWIPDGMPPDQGAYVRYDHRVMIGALTAEAARARAVVIGEDLGTVEPWLHDYLAGQHVLGTEMAWFARDRDGALLPPSRWRRLCMATVGTHDVPPVSAYVTGDQVAVRTRLGLLADPDAERDAAERSISQWREMLVGQRLMEAGRPPTVRDFTVALYGFLARTPAVLVAVSLADAVGDRRTQNIPGTSREYPNWRVPLCDGDGKSVRIEDLPSVELVRQVAAAVSPPGRTVAFSPPR